MQETLTHNTARLELQAAVTPAGFEILAITAGIGKGWHFSAEVLKSSVPLWNNVECFIDHSWFGHSVRDLAGILYDAQYSPEHHGILCKLKPIGPSAPLLIELGKELTQAGTPPWDFTSPKPNVGFSADILFTADHKEVEAIVKVNSVDLVYSPARGGAFLRALNSTHPQFFIKESVMPKEIPPSTNGLSPQESPISDRQVVRNLRGEQDQAVQLAAEAEAARQARIEMCGLLLDTTLAGARLPEPLSSRIRKQFSGKPFQPSELQSAVEDARNLLGELNGGSIIAGPGRIQAMYSSEDRLQAAVDDLFEAPRDPSMQGVKVEKLSGIKELYLLLTGDRDFYGGYYPDRLHLATTADFSGLVKNAMNKIVVNTWEQLGRAGYDWWTKIATVEHFESTQTVTGTLVGTVGALPAVAEGAEYTELAIGDSPETGTFIKYGGYIPLTLELLDRDETRKLKAYPRELAAAGLRKISSLVAAIFTENNGTGPTLADGGALFNSTAVTSAGGHANLLTTALSASQWEVVCTAVYNQPMLIKNATGYYGMGPKMAINPRYLLVPRSLQLTAMKILYPSLENAASIYSENLQRGQPGDVITVPEWTDANDWAAVCDPRIAPAIYIGERFGLMPEIFISSGESAGAVFTNDEHRLKVRHFLAVWVNDFRPLHKSNVA